MMGMYRKKPIVIEAWQNVEGSVPPKWLQGRGGGMAGTSIAIVTLEGVMTANPGDWIIQGVKGEVYPCKPDIFEATYECCAGDASGNKATGPTVKAGETFP
jgi:hypothetical protein